MTRSLAFVPLIAAAGFLAIAPGLAQAASSRDPAQYHQSYRAGVPTVSDPSFGYHPNMDRARALGRCVEDLGYGRFEYCD